MKRILTYIVLVLAIHLQALAQSEKVWERVYVATDKQTYVAGDKVWCSLYCFTDDFGVSVSKFSSTAYLELQTNEQVVLTAKVALENGRGAGAIELPPTLPTGNYKLVAYTKQSRNEEGFVPTGKILSVFNVLTTERLEGSVDIVQEGSIPENSPVPIKYGDIGVTLPAGTISSGKEFFLTLENLHKNAVSLSVSIYNREPYAEEYDYGIVNFWGTVAQSEKGEITEKFLPDYEGEVLELNTSGSNAGLLFASFFGNQSNFYVSSIDDSGKARIITPNVYGDKDLFCEGVRTVSIADPFMRSVTGGIPKLKISPSMEKDLLDMGFSMQVGRRFDSDSLYENLPVRPSLLFDDDNMVVYILDNYTRFPTMEEVIFEFVTELKVRSVNKQKSLVVMLETPGAAISNPQFSTGIPLLMLDGVLVTDHSKIINFDPLLVERIEIWKDAFSVGPRYYEGVANFVTYKKDMAGLELGENVKVLPYKGSLQPMAFTGKNIREGGDYPDYRQTIYWHPILDLQGGESKKIRCIAPLYDGNFEVVIEGVTSDGEAILYRTSLDMSSSSGARTISESEIINMVQSMTSAPKESKPINKTLQATVSSAAPASEKGVDVPEKVVKGETSEPVVTAHEKKAAAVQTNRSKAAEVVPAKALPVAKPKRSKAASQSLPIRKQREGELKEGVKYKSSIEIR